MRDDDWYKPKPPPPLRQPKPREHAWTIRKGARQYDCTFVSHGDFGMEV